MINRITVHAGHNPDGKVACGAVGLLHESTENRIVCEKVVQLLQENGFEVKDCTVNDGTGVADIINKIVYQCNEFNSDLDVSIHFNASARDFSGNGISTGSEVLVYADEGVKGDVARRICNQLSKLGFQNRGVQIRRDLGFLRKTKSPALLVEVCFVDDADDVAIYERDKDAVARGIVKAILNHNKKNMEDI